MTSRSSSNLAVGLLLASVVAVALTVIVTCRRERIILHICDWHFVPKDHFEADLRTLNPNCSTLEIEGAYQAFLKDVAVVQDEQVTLIRAALKSNQRARIWVEGLTPHEKDDFRELVREAKIIDDTQMPVVLEQLQVVENLLSPVEPNVEMEPEMRSRATAIRDELLNLDREQAERRFRLGAVGRLLATGEIDDFTPLDDEVTHAAAFPLTDQGRVVIDETKNRNRERAMTARLLAADSDVSIVILGAAHDLSDDFRGTRVRYIRVVPRSVESVSRSWDDRN